MRRVRPGKRRFTAPGERVPDAGVGKTGLHRVHMTIQEIEDLFEDGEISREKRDSLMNAALDEYYKKKGSTS